MNTEYFLAASLDDKTDLGKSFQKLIDETFTTYKGCLIERTNNGYKVFGKEVSTMAGAQNKIDSAFTGFNYGKWA